MKHPLSLGLIILMQTIMISMLIGMMYNFWYSYILFLILIGGLLILFIYMTSIASNEKFKTNFYLILSFSLIIFSTMMNLIKTNFNINNYLYKNMLTNQNTSTNFLTLSKFMIFPQNKIFLITILYLLISMIAAIKICKFNYGPLRQMLYDKTYSKKFWYIKYF
uniref:NADH-ubiquinone oxidoreductase chain 6 n=1 Tax=Henosepilachna pusillanima TaxID=459481 RepID=W5TZQ8_9CUCU|nr:NADH dehydrogenase subunit 6 [Henosepilachna pusillanima]AHH30004.1 NADH dehydrogenase subunit 6 [Henosepilachna pusillanima]